jgi:FK506-binding protein 2
MSAARPPAAFAALLSLITLPAATCKQCEGYDLPIDAPLRSGVKWKPPVCGTRSKKGDKLRVGYIGALYSSCYKFEESYYEGFHFELGKDPVPQGWHDGLNGMCVFEKRKLTIPANLGFGTRGRDFLHNKLVVDSILHVPKNATLVYEVELLGINGKKPKGEKGRQPGSQAKAAKKKLKPKSLKETVPPHMRDVSQSGFAGGNKDTTSLSSLKRMLQADNEQVELQMAEEQAAAKMAVDAVMGNKDEV